MQTRTISAPRLTAALLMSQVSAMQEAPTLKLTKPAKMAIPGTRLLVLALCLLLAGPAVSECLQQPSGQTRAGKTQAAETESKDALEFLGSYSASSAISTKGAGHVSAHPPSPPPGRRLLQIETGPTLLLPWRDDLAWTRAEISAACGDTAASDRRVRSEVEAARSDGESPPGGLTGYSRQPTPISDNAESKSANCPRLSWNQALALAYARRPGALDGLAAALSGAPSPAAGHLALFLARLSAGDMAATEAGLERVTAAGDKGDKRDSSPEHPRETLGDSGRPLSSSRSSTAGVRERDDLWARAIRAWASGELGEAREVLTRLISLEPDTAAVWFILGGVELEEARVSSRRLAESGPASPWNRRLESAALASRYPDLARSILPAEAKTDASVSTAAGGKTAEPEAQPAGSSPPADDDHLLQAEREIRRLDSLAESPEVLYRRSRAALSLSELAYSRAGRSSLFRPYFHALRALAAEEEQDEPRAWREYRAGLAEDPGSAVLHAGYGHLLRRRLLLKPARAELARAAELDPTDSVAAFELGDVDQRLGDSASALLLLDRALEIDPRLLVACWSRAKAYLALGDDRRALADLEAAAPTDTSGELQWQLGRLYQKIGREDLAIEAERRSGQQRRAAQEKKAAVGNR